MQISSGSHSHLLSSQVATSRSHPPSSPFPSLPTPVARVLTPAFSSPVSCSCYPPSGPIDPAPLLSNSLERTKHGHGGLIICSTLPIPCRAEGAQVTSALAQLGPPAPLFLHRQTWHAANRTLRMRPERRKGPPSPWRPCSRWSRCRNGIPT